VDITRGVTVKCLAQCRDICEKHALLNTKARHMNARPPENQANLWTTMLLCMAVFWAYSFFYLQPQMRETQARQQAERQAKEDQKKAADLPPGATLPQSAPSAEGAPGRVIVQRTATRDAAIALSQRVAIETPSLKGSINLKGGRIDDLKLAKYHEKIDPQSPIIELFSPSEAPEAYFADYGWLADAGSSVALPTRETLWTSAGAASLTPQTPVTLTWDNGAGLKFTRTIAVDDNYMFSVANEVENTGTAPFTLRAFSRIYRDAQTNPQAQWMLHEGLIGSSGATGLKELTYATFSKSDEKRTGKHEKYDALTGGWLGMTDKYWASALIPDQKAVYTATYSTQQKRNDQERDQFETRFELAPVTLAPGAKSEAKSDLYAGAKVVSLIEGYETKLGIEKFNLMIDWGWFWFATKPLYYIMEKINGLVGNFGVTIILLTLLVKGVFFPIANASYESMARMKKLQPEIEKLKERFKDDKERFAKEQMGLFQKEGVNPLMGCVPALLQIPVFTGLYKVFLGTIDMRHAPFFGWIQDLSAPDPTSLFNLFGLLPFSPPQALMIGVWPLIMGVTMWMQMQMNPPQPDPTQQAVFQWMPVMFTFMMASFPAGLVIYWAANNTLTMAQQTVINKRLGVEIHLKDNMIRQWNDIKSVFFPQPPPPKDKPVLKAKKPDEKAKG